MDDQRLSADHKLLKELLGIEPLACTRRANGDLVYLNQAGQKFILTPAEVDALTHKKRILELVPRALEILEENQKPRSHHKKISG